MSTKKSKKNAKFTTIAWIFAVMLLIAVILINVAASFLDVKMDMTPNKLYSLSSTTKNYLEKLDKKVDLYLLMEMDKVREDDEMIAFTTMMDQYAEYENIIFNPSMLIPRQNDVTATDFLLPLMSGKVTVPTIFTPVYPYYTDVIMPIDACDEISKTKPQGYELYIKSQLYQFFFILDNRCRNLTTGSNRKTLDKMKIVLKYIENNYMQKITIADIAATVDFSESHFMRYFKETMGTSFVDYLRDYRLTIASRLLTTSDSSILDIAAESGFENLSYFNRVFKQKYSMTPRQFRKESQ